MQSSLDVLMHLGATIGKSSSGRFFSYGYRFRRLRHPIRSIWWRTLVMVIAKYLRFDFEACRYSIGESSDWVHFRTIRWHLVGEGGSWFHVLEYQVNFFLLGLALGKIECLGGHIYMRVALMKEKMFKAVKSKEWAFVWGILEVRSYSGCVGKWWTVAGLSLAFRWDFAKLLCFFLFCETFFLIVVV